MFVPTLVGALVLAALPVHVESQGCPSADEVEQSLAAMLPPAGGSERPDLAHIFRREGRLHIELTSPDAAIIAERVIDRDGSCSELAELAAVIIASWKSETNAGFAVPAPEPVAGVSRPVPAPIAPKRSATPAYDVALGAVLSVSGSATAGGTLATSWLPRGSGIGVRTSFEGEGARTSDFNQAQARCRRWVGSAEAEWRWRGRATTLDFHGGLAAGWLSASGTGFSRNLSAGSFSPGSIAGVRLSRWAKRWLGIYAEASAIYWLRAQTLYASPSAAPQEVPRFQGLLSIGLTLGESAIGR